MLSCYELLIPVLKSYFQQMCEICQGGQIKEKFENWQKPTDTEILETVKGATLEFESVPQQTFTRPSLKLSAQEEKLFKLKLIN